ncbi:MULTISPECIES: acyltransferase [unclassified Mesorhizobium]|uniref:acyltransferase family protein n=1 Tax=unclassified Mesorhizobium TaxID=325217 RepID=UPI000BB00E7D|nr:MULTISPECIES: acyltransferase [unclassified Mesorhizobium]TGT60854.1 acyltransferase [Mesorhizobium sp. M00.F.Ca.ET.170.01.1.1]AZO10043.1 acyltransferase [Mesorhizobium sp. M3A.F.Ca.ET.080.04.2.1]PBB86503.1 acyltransferase [Mesorhizobium sp. WSM3876]RWB75729.1 MAG: acyltransferase [Mesorhizobium sp.]RWB91482.1 MAG: acyltransferase [Mesorhizobium sp.]
MAQQKITFGGVDILRFLAAVMVMFYHYGFWVWAFPDGVSACASGGVPAHPEMAFVGSGWVGVQVFFVISGFVIAFSAENSTPLKFFEARVRRLAPAVWICAPISAIVLLLADLSWPTDAVVRLARTALFVPFEPWVDSVYWTLGIEIAFYAIVWAMLRLGRFDLIETVAIIIGLASTLFWCLFFAFGWTDLAETRWLQLTLVHHGAFFAVGVLLWLMRFKGLTAARLGFCALCLAGGVLQIVSSVDVHSLKVGATMPYAPPIVIFLAAVALMAWSLRLDLSWRGWRRLGLMTYPLYLIHDVVGAAMLGSLMRTGVPYLVSIPIVGATMVATSWLVASEAEPRIRLLLDHTLFRYRLKPA